MSILTFRNFFRKFSNNPSKMSLDQDTSSGINLAESSDPAAQEDVSHDAGAEGDGAAEELDGMELNTSQHQQESNEPANQASSNPNEHAKHAVSNVDTVKEARIMQRRHRIESRLMLKNRPKTNEGTAILIG